MIPTGSLLPIPIAPQPSLVDRNGGSFWWSPWENRTMAVLGWRCILVKLFDTQGFSVVLPIPSRRRLNSGNPDTGCNAF